jgi:protein required for attachment to host cells
MLNGKPKEAWIVLADARRARLLSAVPTPAGRVHVEAADELECDWEGHEHGRPSMLNRRGPHSGNVAPNHDVEEALHRFARQVRDWVLGQMKARDISSATLFAPARMLGVLRAMDGKLAALDLREGELVRLSCGELANHASIVPLITGAK